MTTNKTYKTTTPSGVRALLRDRHYLGSLRESGDTMASDILIDLDKATNLAKITDRQAMAIALVYGLDLTRGEAATELGVSREAVNQLIWGAAKRIAAVYREWDYGEVAVKEVDVESDTYAA